MARIGAALAFSGVVVVMLVADALLPEYNVNPAILGIVITAICTLLGVEVLDVVRKKHP